MIFQSIDISKVSISTLKVLQGACNDKQKSPRMHSRVAFETEVATPVWLMRTSMETCMDAYVSQAFYFGKVSADGCSVRVMVTQYSFLRALASLSG